MPASLRSQSTTSSKTNLMKKLHLVIPGALALALAASPVLPVFTEAASAFPAEVAERRGERWGRRLNLTEQQQSQMRQIRESTKAKIDRILTSEQQAELQRARQERRRPNLTLTDEQKAQMRAIRQEARRQMDAVLTAEQKQQLEQMRQQRPQRRQQPSQ
jgi:Spy/CpxP family protein refolding chaperone